MAELTTQTRADAHLSDPLPLRVAAVCGIAAQVIFVALWFIWGFLEQHYDVTRQDISDFGALDASHPLAYNIILSLTGALTVVLAYGLYRALRPGIAVVIGSVVVGIFGAGEFLDGILREDCSPSGNAACRAAVDAGDVSWHHTAHDLESLVTIAALIIAPLVFAFVFRNRPEWRWLSVYSAITCAAIVAFVVPYAVLFATNDGSEVNGLLERAAATVGVAWLAMISWQLWRVAGPRSSPNLEN